MVKAMMAAVVLLATPATATGTQGRAANQTAETKMVAALNEVRAQHGLGALSRSGSLMDSARRYSHWLMENDTFRHLSSIQASSRFSMLGEALAWHSGRRFSVRHTVNQWMASPPHRALVLSATMPWVGAGVTRGRLGAASATIWVLHLGRVRRLGTTVPDLGLPVP
jgi:uncharacterized protein YkwD